VTDANVVLGFLPAALLGGEMRLDVEAARSAVQRIADGLDVSLERAAEGIIAIVNESMYGALRLVSVQQGYDPRDFALVAFGGAGPLHANALGVLLGSWPVIIPPSPGVLNAYGDATTVLRDEASRTFIRELSDTSAQEVRQMLGDLREQAAMALDAFGISAADQQARLEVDLRYRGQGFELTVGIPAEDLSGLRLEQLSAQFDAEHEKVFGFGLDAARELVNLRAIVSAPEDATAPPEIPAGGSDATAARTERAQVWVEGGRRDAWIYDRARLAAGNRIDGPAIVTEMDSTTLVLPGHHATVDAHGNLLIRPDEPSRVAAASGVKR
jgi:N-methylhydantoinase A